MPFRSEHQSVSFCPSSCSGLLGEEPSGSARKEICLPLAFPYPSCPVSVGSVGVGKVTFGLILSRCYIFSVWKFAPTSIVALVIGCLTSSVTFKTAELWGQETEGSHTVLPLRPAASRIRSLEGKRLKSRPGLCGSSSPLPEHYSDDCSCVRLQSQGWYPSYKRKIGTRGCSWVW